MLSLVVTTGKSVQCSPPDPALGCLSFKYVTARPFADAPRLPLPAAPAVQPRAEQHGEPRRAGPGRLQPAGCVGRACCVQHPPSLAPTKRVLCRCYLPGMWVAICGAATRHTWVAHAANPWQSKLHSVGCARDCRPRRLPSRPFATYLCRWVPSCCPEDVPSSL